MDDLLFNDLIRLFEKAEEVRTEDSKSGRCIFCKNITHPISCEFILTKQRLIKYKRETDNDKKGNKNLIDFGINPANC